MAAFRGADAVVSAVGRQHIAAQQPLIDAAVDAGVKRFLPSEGAGDISNEAIRDSPATRPKVKIQDHLVGLAEAGKIEWTAVGEFPSNA